MSEWNNWWNQNCKDQEMMKLKTNPIQHGLNKQMSNEHIRTKQINPRDEECETIKCKGMKTLWGNLST
jgi:hypothetical protein